MLKLLLTFSEYSDSIQSSAILLRSCPIFHLKSSFTRKYFHFSLQFGFVLGKATSFDVVHILNVSLGISNTQHAIKFSKEPMAEEKYWLNFYLFLLEFRIMHFLLTLVILLHSYFIGSLLLTIHILRLTKYTLSRSSSWSPFSWPCGDGYVFCHPNWVSVILMIEIGFNPGLCPALLHHLFWVEIES